MRTLSVALLGLLLFVAPVASARQRGEDELRRDMEFARQQVFPALVNIAVVMKTYADGRSERFPAAGSGVIVSPAGHVVTNFHVAGEADRIVCRLPTKESIDADVVAHDPLTDLSILKLRLEERKNRNRPIPFARLGDSDELATGDYVLAMGNPLTLSSSMTLGIVGNPHRVFANFTGSEMDELDLGEGQVTGLFTQWIQHDALILPGNSGGPLVDMNGLVVGINELGGGGLGFAIPSNLVLWVLNQALSYGEIRRGWLGIELVPTAKSGETGGAIVSFVDPGGPGQKLGLQPGDRLLTVAGAPTEALHLEQIPLLYARFAQLDPGATVDVTWRHGTEVKSGHVEVARMEKYLAPEEEDRHLGLTIRNITGPMALLRQYPDSKGVLVTGVRPGYPAESAKPPLRSGDVIRKMDSQPVPDAAAYHKILNDRKDAKKLAVQFRRGESDMVTVLDLEKEKPHRGGGELPKAWMGVAVQVLTPDVAEALGHKGQKGFRITEVYPGTKAADAGLQVGDILTALNGDPLRASRVQDAEMLERRIERLDVDSKATLTLFRGAEERKIDVDLQESPETAAEVARAKDEILEYGVRNLTFRDRLENRWPRDQKGVLVTQVTSGGWAQLAGLRTGDLLLRLNDVEIGGIGDFRRETKKIAEDHPVPVTFLLKRAYRTKILFAQPEYPKER